MEYPPIPEQSFNTEKWFTSIFKSNEKSEIDLVNKHNFHLEYHKIRPLISLLDTKNYDTILYEIKNCILKPQVYPNGNITGFGYTFHINNNDGSYTPCYSIENCVFEKFCSRGDWDRPFYSHQERRLAWQNECLRKNIASMKRTIESITLTQQRQTEVIDKFIDTYKTGDYHFNFDERRKCYDGSDNTYEDYDNDVSDVFIETPNLDYIRPDGRRPCFNGSNEIYNVATIICFCGNKAKKNYKYNKPYLCCNNKNCNFFTWFPY
jgi:hypothetical protein